MARFIVKVDRTNGIFRLVVPRKLIQLKMWSDVKYVLLDDSCLDQLIIRRFVDVKALETDD